MLVKILIGILIAIITFRVLAWLLAWYLRYRLGKFMAQQQQRMQDAFSKQAGFNAASESSSPKSQERMVRCSECGVFVPSSQAIVHKGLSFCDAAHSEAFAEKNS